MGVEGMMGMVTWWMWRAQGPALEIPSLRGQRQVDPRAYWSTGIISRFQASKRHCLERKNNLKKKRIILFHLLDVILTERLHY